jgi:hypothetical protein
LKESAKKNRYRSGFGGIGDRFDFIFPPFLHSFIDINTTNPEGFRKRKSKAKGTSKKMGLRSSRWEHSLVMSNNSSGDLLNSRINFQTLKKKIEAGERYYNPR